MLAVDMMVAILDILRLLPVPDLLVVYTLGMLLIVLGLLVPAAAVGWLSWRSARSTSGSTTSLRSRPLTLPFRCPLMSSGCMRCTDSSMQRF